ncbi:MAG: hypothetical protein NXI32_04250 [bacterium]|nr:hypothetical protein [bacterium]
MKNRVLALSLVIGASLSLFCGSAEAQIPFIRGGAPVFRAAQFRADGPQPFSTRSSRAAAAARSQTAFIPSSTNVNYPNYSNQVKVLQPTRRVIFFQRGRFFR